MSHRGENQDQEPEHTRFYRLDRSWSFDGDDHVISVAACTLHISSTADAALGSHLGFVSDEHLNSLGPRGGPLAPPLARVRIRRKALWWSLAWGRGAWGVTRRASTAQKNG
jgi:hypothetical protein